MIHLRELNLLTYNLNGVQILNISNEGGALYRRNDFGDEGLTLIAKRLTSLQSLSAMRIGATAEGTNSVARCLC